MAVTFADGGSGIAVTFFLDTDTGQLVATSRLGPGYHKAISGLGEFLIGFQGYDAFRTGRYDAAGIVVQEWPTHALFEEEKRAVINKIILLSDERVAFALHDELIILAGTGLGPLDGGIWPCADGGLHGNPVLH